MLVSFGQSSGAVPAFNPALLAQKGSLYLTRPVLSHYIAKREELTKRASDLFTWLTEGKLQLSVDRTYALSDAGQAHRDLESRQTKGKLLLIP
jgi:NADPH2:quinone reductase